MCSAQRAIDEREYDCLRAFNSGIYKRGYGDVHRRLAAGERGRSGDGLIIRSADCSAANVEVHRQWRTCVAGATETKYSDIAAGFRRVGVLSGDGDNGCCGYRDRYGIGSAVQSTVIDNELHDIRAADIRRERWTYRSGIR